MYISFQWALYSLACLHIVRCLTVSHAFDGLKIPTSTTTSSTANPKAWSYRIPVNTIATVPRPSKGNNGRYSAQLIDDSDNPWFLHQSSSTSAIGMWDSIRNAFPSSSSSMMSTTAKRRDRYNPASFLPFPTSIAVPKQQQSTTSNGSTLEMIVSLVKAIVGGGVLAIPAAVTTLGDSPQQVLPIAVALIVTMGTINAYYFSIMGKVCAWTGATTFSQAWERTMGVETSSLFASIICVKTALSCLAYSMIIAESFQSMAISAGLVDTTQTEALLAITCTALLPLCLMKDLSSLAPFSLAGILGFAYTGGAMSLRAHDGSYHLAPIDTLESGKYLIDLQDPYKPSFGNTGPEIQGVVLACTLATAFVSHYNAPRFHNELKRKDQFDTVTYTSFGLSAILMSVIAVAGFTTFGMASAPVILNNYSPYDSLIGAGRAAIAASLVATFPFPFFGLRDSVWDVMNVPGDQRNTPESDQKNTLVTVGLLTIITGAALSVNDLSLLLSVGGGTIATAVYSVFPTLMFRAAVKNQQTAQTTSKFGATNTTNQCQFDVNLATGLMGLCVVTGATGVGLALQNHIGH
jgi:amino acid permease